MWIIAMSRKSDLNSTGSWGREFPSFQHFFRQRYHPFFPTKTWIPLLGETDKHERSNQPTTGETLRKAGAAVGSLFAPLTFGISAPVPWVFNGPSHWHHTNRPFVFVGGKKSGASMRCSFEKQVANPEKGGEDAAVQPPDSSETNWNMWSYDIICAFFFWMCFGCRCLERGFVLSVGWALGLKSVQWVLKSFVHLESKEHGSIFWVLEILVEFIAQYDVLIS